MADKPRKPPEPIAPRLLWDIPGWQPFADRLDFLAPDKQQFHDGRMRILPPKGLKARK